MLGFLEARMQRYMEANAEDPNHQTIIPAGQVASVVVGALLAGSDAPNGKETMAAIRAKEGSGIGLARVLMSDRRLQLHIRFITTAADPHRRCNPCIQSYPSKTQLIDSTNLVVSYLV